MHRRGFTFEQTWIPITQKYFMSSFIEIGSLVVEKPNILNVIDEDKDENEDKFWA